MDKNIVNVVQPTFNHNVILHDRKFLEITGVKKIDSFDSEEFLLETIMGYMLIRGFDLEISKLDTEKGLVHINGEIKDISYLESEGKSKEEGVFARLFKW